MRLLLDQGLARSTAVILRSRGIDAVHVGEIGMSRSSDDEILKEAVRLDRIVVTLDADFHDLLAIVGLRKPSVVRIRIEGLDAEATADLLMRSTAECNADLIFGALVTIEPSRIRVRRMPVK